MNIGGIAVGGDHPCRTIFEVSNNFNGSLALAHRLVDGAKEAGADFVKFQAYTPDELVALRGDGPAPAQWGEQGWTMRALYDKAQTPLAWLPELFAHARDIGLVPFSSVFGEESLAALEAIDSPAYKIARLDNQHTWLAEACMQTGKPLLASGYGDDVAVTHTVIADAWLFCPPGYPAVVTELPYFSAEGYLGLSSHCLDPRLPIAAVARGAKMLEYHVQLDDVASELESNISLTVSQFKAMVADIRATEILCG